MTKFNRRFLSVLLLLTVLQLMMITVTVMISDALYLNFKDLCNLVYSWSIGFAELSLCLFFITFLYVGCPAPATFQWSIILLDVTDSCML